MKNKNLLFVTVGVSALDAARRTQPGPFADKVKALADQVVAFKRDKTPQKEQLGEAVFNPLLKLHLTFWLDHQQSWDDPEVWRQTSAELITTATLLRQLKDKVNIVIDHTVLLVSETVEGKLAGQLVEAVMLSNEYPYRFSKGALDVLPIPGMASGGAVEQLPDALLRAVDKHRDSERDRVIFNVTAGYGGTSTLIGMLAVKHGFRIYYQHDSMKEPIFISQSLKIGHSAATWMIGNT
jgi:putative CRISPR-associated protein (TIGR02619 family)